MPGLDDVIAAETVLSDVDGANGRLIIRGKPVEELARSETAEFGRRAAARRASSTICRKGRSWRPRSAWRGAGLFRRLQPHLAAIASLPPVEALRAGMALIPDGDDFETALMLLAAPAVLTPAIIRLRRGEQPLGPDAERRPGRRYAADAIRRRRQRTPPAAR